MNKFTASFSQIQQISSKIMWFRKLTFFVVCWVLCDADDDDDDGNAGWWSVVCILGRME